MPYYRGDYYRGDNYYQGDFLGIGKAIKGLISHPLRTITAVASGGISEVARAGLNFLGSKLTASKQTNLPAVLPPAPSMMAFAPRQAGLINVGSGVSQSGLINIEHDGQGGVVGTSATGRRRRLCAKNIGGQALLVPCPRRMNVTNVRALRRAGRRVKGFLKLAARFGALPVNRGKGGKLFKRKRHAR